MLARELIDELERRIIEHGPLRAVMGELEIYIDQFAVENGEVLYKGASPDIRITYSRDGVLPILTAWTPETK